MSLKINKVKNASVPEKEYVLLKATADTNSKGYAIVDRTFGANGTISNEFKHIFFLPALALKSGDWIRIYTGKGSPNTGTNSNNISQKVYNLYWQADSCVWNDAGGDTVSLINYSLVEKTTVPPVEKK